MPNYKGHLFGATSIFAILFFICALYKFSILEVSGWFAAILLGSLFPDIDTKSKGQKIFYGLVFGSVLFLIFFDQWLSASFIGLFSFIPILAKHRGIFHKLWFNGLLVLSGIFILIQVFPNYDSLIIINGAFFFLGIFSHLWLDLGFKRAVGLR